MATTKLYLDARKLRQDGTAPMRIMVRHNNKTASIPTSVTLKPSQWDTAKQKVIGCPQRVMLNDHLASLMVSVREALMKISQGARPMRLMTAKELCERTADILHPQEEGAVLFGVTYKAFAERHENPRTRQIYADTWHMIEKYDRRAGSLTFEDVDKAWLESFFTWCGKTSPSVNARNIHLRNIRAVFNDAIDNDLTTAYPFRRLKIRPVATAKRNLPISQLASLIFGECKDWQRKYVDAFYLSFLLIGINMADLLTLPKSALQDGRLVYNRKKTKRLYSIKVEAEAMELLRKYEGRERLLSFAEGCTAYTNFAMRMNRCLTSLMEGVTTYYARHSWATIAASLDIPKDTIAAALGHGGNSVTDIYIEFDRDKIDEANKAVISALLAFKNKTMTTDEEVR